MHTFMNYSTRIMLLQESTKASRLRAQTAPEARPPRPSLSSSPMPVPPLLLVPQPLQLSVIYGLIETILPLNLVYTVLSRYQTGLHPTMRPTVPSANAGPGMLTPMSHSLARLSLLKTAVVLGNLNILLV